MLLPTDPDWLKARLAFINALRAELADIKALLRERRAREAKYNPRWREQPRAPKGDSDGGRWVDGGGSTPAQDAIHEPDPGDARLLPIQDGWTGIPTTAPFPAETVTTKLGDNPTRIARQRLGRSATNEEIIAYARELQSLNNISDATRITERIPLVLPEAQAATIEASAWFQQELDTQGSTYHALSASEYIAGRLAFGDLIAKGNWRAVRIVRGPGANAIAELALADPHRPAITLGNTIFVQARFYDRWNGDLTSTADSRASLLHELTHVFQWQHSPGVGAGVVLDAVRHGINEAYAYYNRPHTTFRTETLEGQAKMVGDYATLRYSRQLNTGQARDIARRLTGTGIYGF